MLNSCVYKLMLVWALVAGLFVLSCAKEDSTNKTAEPELVVVFEPPAGTFVDSQVVKLSAVDRAEIHYTLDGSMPSLSSPVYTAPLTLEESTRLHAVALILDSEDGESGTSSGGAGGTETSHRTAQRVRRQGLVSGTSYLRVNAEAAAFTSHLPLIIIQTTKFGAIDATSSTFVPAHLLVMEPKQGRTSLIGSASLDTRCGIHVHGEMAREQDKLKYTVEFWADNADVDRDLPLLGMPKDSDWILLDAIDADTSLIKNALASELSKRINRYAPRTQFVEVYLSTHDGAIASTDFLGFYTVMEKIKRGSERVNVQKLSSGNDAIDLTGGYILRIDKGVVDFQAANYKWQFVYPKATEMVEAKRAPHLAYIQGDIAGLGKALASSDFHNPDTGKHYSEYIDVDSFIDHNIINAYMKNVDGLRFSTYFFKDRGGLLNAGPIWDFDRCAGALEEWRSTEPAEWFLPGTDGTDYFNYGLWGELFTDPDFKARYIARFRSLLDNEYSEAAVLGLIDSLAAKVGDAAERNYVRWPDYRPFGKTHASEIERVKTFFSKRTAFIKNELDAGLF